ncbi:hypothetical protein GIB67_030405 [Kingdonia uniflora]|uniref:DUF4283 domain-containing protein n=1 Tax=Kingdonia uniflora TaxID=39325 RepID=A0A7J7NDQ9_9MAGN|nr:hypothetical protein GIB67_030405 [Kingdonia uniflora]
MALGRTMGTPIHVDRTQSDFGYFAKVLVDIDLAEPIPNKVLVEVEDGDFWQKVELGSLSKFCPHCKMMGHNLSECRGVRAQVQREEEIKDKRNQEVAKKGTGENKSEESSFIKNQKKRIRKKRNKEQLGNGIGLSATTESATTESGGKEVGEMDEQITTDELFQALIPVEECQNNGAASACQEGVTSTSSGTEYANIHAGTKEGADSISQLIRETSMILLHKDENWADMVKDEERDEACVAKSASNIIFWNIRGIANKKSFLSLKRFVKLFGPQIIFIAEPKIRPTKFLHGLSNFNNAIISNDCDARIGNLWCMWSTEVSMPSLVSSSYQHISVLCDGAIISAVHASAFKIVRRGLWKDLIDVSKLNLPWLALGDFNIIRLQSERFGGMKLTWCNGQSGGARISRRLDRALYNGLWAGKYDGWKVKALARENSDHSALVGGPNPIPKPKNILFRFLKCWIEFPGFQDLVKTSWEAAQAGNPIIKLMKKLQRLKIEIKIWRKAATGGLAVDISRCLEALENLHTLLKFADDETLIKEAANMEEELNRLLATENSI